MHSSNEACCVSVASISRPVLQFAMLYRASSARSVLHEQQSAECSFIPQLVSKLPWPMPQRRATDRRMLPGERLYTEAIEAKRKRELWALQVQQVQCLACQRPLSRHLAAGAGRLYHESRNSTLTCRMRMRSSGRRPQKHGRYHQLCSGILWARESLLLLRNERMSHSRSDRKSIQGSPDCSWLLQA